MPLLLAITGAPGVGKSTLVRRVLERLDCKKGGGKAMFVVVQAKSQHPLALKIKSEAALVTETEKNRNFLADEIVAKIAADVTAFSAKSS